MVSDLSFCSPVPSLDQFIFLFTDAVTAFERDSNVCQALRTADLNVTTSDAVRSDRIRSTKRAFL